MKNSAILTVLLSFSLISCATHQQRGVAQDQTPATGDTSASAPVVKVNSTGPNQITNGGFDVNSYTGGWTLQYYGPRTIDPVLSWDPISYDSTPAGSGSLKITIKKNSTALTARANYACMPLVGTNQAFLAGARAFVPTGQSSQPPPSQASSALIGQVELQFSRTSSCSDGDIVVAYNMGEVHGFPLVGQWSDYNSNGPSVAYAPPDAQFVRLRLGAQTISTFGTPTVDWDIMYDNVFLKQFDTPPPVTNIRVANIRPNSVDAAWDASGGSIFDFVAKAQKKVNFTLPATTTNCAGGIATHQQNLTYPGLTASTDYTLLICSRDSSGIMSVYKSIDFRTANPSRRRAVHH